MSIRGSSTVLWGLVALALAAGGALAEDEEPEFEDPEAGGREPAEPAQESPGWFAALLADPLVGGRLHVTYRASYTARVYDFKGYDQAFSVSNPGSRQADREQELLVRERHRDISDQDLDQYAAIQLEQLPVLEGSSKWLQSAGGEASFRFFKDLDGSPAGEEAHGGFDRYDHREAFHLQTLNVRLEALTKHLDLVLGRQYGREAQWLHFDGATATLRGVQVFGRETEISAFGGSRVYFYSHSSSTWSGLAPRGEEMLGGHVKSWITDSTRLRLSDVHYADNSFEAELRQDFDAGDWASLLYRQVNEDPHSVLLDLAWEWLERDVTLYVSYIGKLGRNADDFNFDYTQSVRRKSHENRDIYFNIGDIEPYDEGTLELRKGFGRWGAFCGGTVHRLRERDLEDNYNTDWQEAWVGLDANDLLWRGLSGRSTVRYVHTDLPRRRIRIDPEVVAENGVPDFLPEDAVGAGEPSYLGVEALLEQDFQRKVAVGATAVFRAYDYRNNFAEIEGLTAASLAGHVRWRATHWSQLFLSYAYDTDYRFINPDLEALHTVRVQWLLKW